MVRKPGTDQSPLDDIRCLEVGRAANAATVAHLIEADRPASLSRLSDRRRYQLRALEGSARLCCCRLAKKQNENTTRIPEPIVGAILRWRP
ncbi:MAG: hypothetical protein R3D30_08345 [Hyphomicrobiales bacterium]